MCTWVEIPGRRVFRGWGILDGCDLVSVMKILRIRVDRFGNYLDRIICKLFLDILFPSEYIYLSTKF